MNKFLKDQNEYNVPVIFPVDECKKCLCIDKIIIALDKCFDTFVDQNPVLAGAVALISAELTLQKYKEK